MRWFVTDTDRTLQCIAEVHRYNGPARRSVDQSNIGRGDILEVMHEAMSVAQKHPMAHSTCCRLEINNFSTGLRKTAWILGEATAHSPLYWDCGEVRGQLWQNVTLLSNFPLGRDAAVPFGSSFHFVRASFRYRIRCYQTDHECRIVPSTDRSGGTETGRSSKRPDDYASAGPTESPGREDTQGS